MVFSKPTRVHLNRLAAHRGERGDALRAVRHRSTIAYSASLDREDGTITYTYYVGMLEETDRHVFYDDGQMKTVCSTRNKECTCLHWYRGGALEAEETTLNYSKHGTRTTWYEATYQENELHGKRTLWYDNGNKEQEDWWKNGVEHGRNTSWRRDGTRIGEHFTYYGEFSGRMHYWNDLEHGKWTNWDMEGNKTLEGELRGGSFCGTVHCWEDGKPARCDDRLTKDGCVLNDLGASCPECSVGE